MNKLDKFKAWAVKNKAVIIASAVVVVLAASGVTGTQLYLRTQGIEAPEETTTEPIDYSAYEITTQPETETTVEQDGDRTIIKDSDGNETVNRTWNEADETVKSSGNVNGGGGTVKTNSNGTYTGEQSTTAPAKTNNAMSANDSGVFGDVNGDGKSGCVNKRTLSDEEKASLLNEEAHFVM